MFHGVNFFFLLFGNILSETYPQPVQTRSPYMDLLGVLIMQMMESHKHTPPFPTGDIHRAETNNL